MSDFAFRQPLVIQSGDGEITPLMIHAESTTRYEASANGVTVSCEYVKVSDIPAAVAASPDVDCKVSTPEFTPSSCFEAMLKVIEVNE